MEEKARAAVIELEQMRRADPSMWWVPLEDKFSGPLSEIRRIYKPKHSPLPGDFKRLEKDVAAVLREEFGSDRAEVEKFHRLYELSILF